MNDYLSDPALKQQLRELAPFDESIHSFLLRTQLCYDQNVKPIGVITSTGKWAIVPYANKELNHLFHRFADHQLLEAIDVSLSINGQGNTLFASPSFYVDRIEKTFFHNCKTSAGVGFTGNIRYCSDCIKEGIEKLGY